MDISTANSEVYPSSCKLLKYFDENIFRVDSDDSVVVTPAAMAGRWRNRDQLIRRISFRQAYIAKFF